jgi:Calcineurin-like phosphoesterase
VSTPPREPPPFPKDESPAELGFEPQKMVRWFDPVQLAGTALQVVVSGVFGAYSDKREIQAALARDVEPDRDYADGDEIWVDYVADLGDGFEPTYTIAYLLSRPTLTVRGGSGSWETKRGRILVMGGDQVYPTAERTQYENRLIGPYRAALSYVADEGSAPHLYAIPGNHDWYDGLTSFVRFFCQQRWIGGWKTRQKRSYFALELPHRWWLWGIDIQFDAYIDDPQLDYFRKARELLEPGDRVILMTGKPSWTKGPEEAPSYRNLAFFEKEMLAGRGATLAVVVSGDLHHYCRYGDHTGGRQRITAGGGGAYLYPTHHMRDTLVLKEGAAMVEYSLEALYPPKDRSESLRWKAPWRLPLRNGRLLPVFFAFYLALALMLQIPVRKAIMPSYDVRFGDVPDLWVDAVTSRWAVFVALVLLPLLMLAAAGRGPAQKLPLGIAHAIPHFLLITWLVPLSAWLLSQLGWSNYGILIAALAAAVASIPGASILGLYLCLCDWIFGDQRRLFGDNLDRHANEAFSCQGIEDWKNFLRFHIDRDGVLTIFPIGVERVFRYWRGLRAGELRLNKEGRPGDPFFLPPEREVARLAEDEPITVGFQTPSV